jgi:Holliday junction resolvase RusA-like endonuclease
MKLTIHRLPLSPNRLRYRHWRVTHSDKQDWLAQIMAAIPRDQRGKRCGQEKRAAQIVLFSPYKSLDPDNLHGAVKPILDALSKHKLIYDDAGEWLEYSVRQRKVKTTSELRTEIKIEKSGGVDADKEL